VRLGIAGVGLIGTSIALRAVRAGWQVAGWDADPAQVLIATRRGALSEAPRSLRELARSADVLVLAAPLDATLEHLRELVGVRPSAELILDVASVKVPVVRAGATLETFIATHPIAGSERSGPAAGDPDLFVGRTWAYDANVTGPVVARARAFIELMGARPLALACDEHDRIVALTSHLPQVLSVALGALLAERLDDEHVARLCGTGIASLLRLAGSSWPMWQPVFAANAAAVAQEVRRLGGVLSEAADALEDGRYAVLGADFDAAAAAVSRLARSSADANER
jgi:prephenate dehydrogenase